MTRIEIFTRIAEVIPRYFIDTKKVRRTTVIKKTRKDSLVTFAEVKYITENFNEFSLQAQLTLISKAEENFRD